MTTFFAYLFIRKKVDVHEHEVPRVRNTGNTNTNRLLVAPVGVRDSGRAGYRVCPITMVRRAGPPGVAKWNQRVARRSTDCQARHIGPALTCSPTFQAMVGFLRACDQRGVGGVTKAPGDPFGAEQAAPNVLDWEPALT